MSSTPQLRHYQRDEIARVEAEIADAVVPGRHVLFLAHRRELVTQASRKLHAAGVEHGILLPGFPSHPREAVQVASIATLHARAVRTAAMDPPRADLVFLDEAQHCRNQTCKRLLDAYPGAAILGLTATPCPVCGRRPRNRSRIAHPLTYDSDDQLRFYRQLLYIANQRGYARGWVAHKYKEKFGDWPASRLPPDDAVRSWARSRRIAYPRAMAKQGAA
jgi:rRNA maturation protein Nop10